MCGTRTLTIKIIIEKKTKSIVIVHNVTGHVIYVLFYEAV